MNIIILDYFSSDVIDTFDHYEYHTCNQSLESQVEIAVEEDSIAQQHSHHYHQHQESQQYSNHPQNPQGYREMEQWYVACLWFL